MSRFRLAKVLGLAIALLAVAAGSFFAARTLAGPSGDRQPLQSKPTPRGTPIFSVEGPFFEGAINGIRVITYETWEAEGSWPQDDCANPATWANNYPVSLSEAEGTPLAINPTYLPAAAVEQPLNPKDELS